MIVGRQHNVLIMLLVTERPVTVCCRGVTISPIQCKMTL